MKQITGIVIISSWIVVKPSYPQSEKFYTGNTAFCYWNEP